MMPIVSFWAAVLTALSSVTGLSVVPAGDRTEVVIAVDGPVSVEHFALRDPDRLVVDVATARQGLARTRFDGIDRGGVVALRVSQFEPQVVRIVVELAQPTQYTVEQGDGEIRLSFPNPAGSFAPWHSGASAAVVGTQAALPDRPTAAAAPAPMAPEPTRSVAPPSAVYSVEPPITIFFKDTDILDVLATFAEFSGRSIVPGRGVEGKVTADIRDQPWDVALEAVLASHGLAARELESGIIRVDKLTELRALESAEPLITERFQIKYARADSALVNVVRGLLSDSAATVTVNPVTNTILVTDRQSVVRNRIAPMIEQLDVRTPQVTIAAKIIFVDRTSLEELGVVYDIKDSRGNQFNHLIPGGIDRNGDGIISHDEITNESVVRLGGPSFAALANARTRIAKPALEVLGSLAIGRFSLFTFIDALSELSVSDIQASPVISTLDHRTARVQVGEKTPIRVVDAGAQGGGGGQGGGNQGAPMATVNFEDTGIILEVTPHVTGDQILLELHAERSNVAAAAADIGYYFQKQTTDTQILLNDGETAVISGMTIVEKSESRQGIPFLMDLPVIGALFRTTSERETKKDLLIMVTPHIIREG